MQVYLLNYFIVLLVSFLLTIEFTRKFRQMDPEQRLKVYDLNFQVRKTMIIGMMIAAVLIFFTEQFHLVHAGIMICIIAALLVLLNFFLTRKLYKKHGVSRDFVRRATVYKTIIAVLILAYYSLSFSYYYLTDNWLSKSDLDYAHEGQQLVEKKHYAQALKSYSKAIELNDENGDYYSSRGYCKYFLNDRKGACKDWKIASLLGSKTGLENYRNFCK